MRCFASDSRPAWSPTDSTIAFVRHFFFDYDSAEMLVRVKNGVETERVGYATGYHYFVTAPS